MALFKKRKVESQSKKRPTDDKDEAEESDQVVKTQKKQKTGGSVRGGSEVGMGNSDDLKVQYDHSHSEALVTKHDDDKSHEQEEEKEKKPKVAKFGPIKASGHIKSTTIIDYQPDVCKDYKQTGYCGYGDSCKFLHAREDYAAGWKLDKEWDEEQKKLKEGKTNNTPTSNEESPEIPFKCVICKGEYKNPVETKCKHYFCESCFMSRYRKKPGCFICGKDTSGIAKPVKDMKERIMAVS